MKTEPNRLFPLIVTDRLAEVRAFYVDRLGFSPRIDTPDYLQVQLGDAAAPELCFIEKKPDGPFAKVFAGGGIIVSVPTIDADATHAAWRKKKIPLLSAPMDMPWGWRSFTLQDPTGVILDFFHVLAETARQDATG